MKWLRELYFSVKEAQVAPTKKAAIDIFVTSFVKKMGPYILRGADKNSDKNVERIVDREIDGDISPKILSTFIRNHIDLIWNPNKRSVATLSDIDKSVEDSIAKFETPEAPKTAS